MNAIQLFQQQQLSKQQQQRPMDTSESCVEEEKRPAAPSGSKKRYTGDLRQKSLAMYKSINNMLTLVNKKDFAPILKLSASEVEGTLLDFALRELQQIGPPTVKEVLSIRSIAEGIMRPEILEEARWKEVEEAAAAEEEQEAKPAAVESSEGFIDAPKLKGLMKKDLNLLKQSKRESESKDSGEFNDGLGLEVSVAATQGHRKAMEDQYVIVNHLNELLGLDFEDQAWFGVYDGHSGKAAAEYARTHLHVNVLRDHLFGTDLLGAIQNGYKKTDEDFNKLAMREGMTSGTTAVTALVRGGSVHIANVGDSEAVLCRGGKAKVISFAHLPDKDGEKERIQKCGGTVVWYGTWRVNGLLSVSRSIGDNNLKDVCIPVPFVSDFRRSNEDQFLILATDGLWDVVSHQEACDIVIEQLKVMAKKDVSQYLVDEAIRKKTGDNVAVLIIFFNNNECTK